MSEYGPGFDWTMIAEPDISAKQYNVAVIGSATGKCMVSSQAGDQALGILQNKPQSGEAAKVRVLGISKAYAGTTITAGQYTRAGVLGTLCTGNSGNVVGTALTDAASGGVFTMLVHPHQSTA